MRICSIASGSSGNCVYVGSDTTHLLVDAGISRKRIEAGLNALELSLKDLDGILITHEHSDHISGLGVLLKKREIPIYATGGTIRKMRQMDCLRHIPEDLFQEVREEEHFTIKDVLVAPMQISHDAAQPAAYRFRHDKKWVGVLTDLGMYNDYTVECMRGMDAILLEANHDVRMLETGRYPYYLKQRILGERGHLSNELSGRFLSRILHDGMKAIILGHLSQENNLAELAYETVRLEISMADTVYQGNDFPISVAKRSEVSEMIEV
jgi:phosphoribosyl 1,2-cyclic phosphodiesterase